MRTERQIEDELKEAAQRATDNRLRRAAKFKSLAQIEPDDQTIPRELPGEIK